MSVGYVPVQWNQFKRGCDAVLAGGIVSYLLVFMGVGSLVWRGERAISLEILLMRALGTCAIILLHLILSIGPLARLHPRFLPLLYNRRHLGVTMFLLALGHGIIALGYYHGFGNVNPLISLLEHDADWHVRQSLPFQILGAIALLILFLMAATSHDFWLKNLTTRVWKTLHMLVYPAYGLVVLHVALGALQSERSPLYPVLLLAGVAAVVSLHLVAGWRERRTDHPPCGPQTARETFSREIEAPERGFAERTSSLARPLLALRALLASRACSERHGNERWIDAGAVENLADGRGRVVCTAEQERIAVFRHGHRISAVGNVCAHQGGPLGEGRIIDGCITCPWHGWQYRPADGQSPPPFTEKIPTYRVQVREGRVWVESHALPPGTPVEPAVCEEFAHV